MGQLLNVIDRKGDLRDMVLFRFLWHYGLRIGECLAIQMSDIDLERDIVKIRRLKNGIDREFPIRYDNRKLLKKYLRFRKKLNSSKDNPFLFISNRSIGCSVAKIFIQKRMVKYAEEAQISKKNVHSIRHGTAVFLLSQPENDIYYVKNFLGHRNLQSTMIYADYAPVDWNRRTKIVLNNFPF